MVGIQPPTSVLRGGVGRGSGGGLLSPSQFFRSPPAPTTTLQQQRRQQQPSPQHRATLITSNTTKDINTHLSLESMVICSNARSITVPPPDTTSTAATATAGTGTSNASTKTIHTSNNDCDNDSLFYQGISININANNHNDTYADNDIGNGEEKKEDEAVDYCNNNTFDGKGKNRGRDNHCINIDDISNNNNIIDGNNHDENGEPKRASNVKVCIRLRPMLPSDSIDADTNAKYYDNIKTTTTTAMKRHSSGLITPSSFSSALKRTTLTPTTTKSSTRRITNGAADRLEDNTMDAQKNNVAPISSSSSTLLLPKPAWITHPTNPHRITQSIHPTTTTTTGGSSSSGGGISTTSTNSNSNNSATTIPAADYTFDRVYGPNESTIALYNENIQSIVANVVKGYHGSVFAYGQTNSGKTHTMTGSKSAIGGSGNDSGTGNEEEDSMGVIRLAVRDIFHQIQHSSKRHSTTTTTSTTSASSTSSREYLVRVSYLEIYNEQIYDLLVAPSSPQLASASSSSLIIQNHHHHVPSSSVPSLSPSIIRIFESRTEGVVIRGLREEIVTCPEDVFALLDAGDARRKVGSTALNKTSSRSHSVFRLVLESRCCAAAAAAAASSTSSSTIMTSSSSGGSATAGFEGPVRISSLSLVDLAGSESVKATGSTGLRQKEGQYINKSLLTLGHVIHKLSEMSSREVISDGKGNQEHIPYRDSKLTRLLQPSLGGNAQVCIICNVSPSPKNAEESHNTLKFAMRAKRIVQYARITEVVDKNTLLRSYREEIEELKRQLREARKTAMASDEKLVIQNQSNQHVHETPMSKVRSSSFNNGDHHDENDDDDDDDDDAHVLVSAIANLESLILKTGARCSSRKTNRSTSKSISSTIATKTVGESIDESSPSEPSRALDMVLLKAETSDITTDDVASDMMSSPGVTSDDSVLIKSCVSTPSAITQPNEGGDVDDPNLLEELHRIQSMLGTVMKKKRRGTFGGAKSTPGGSDGSNKVEYRTPKRDAEMERLRMQLQEQEVASTMRKADSSFLQNQLNEKEGCVCLSEVIVYIISSSIFLVVLTLCFYWICLLQNPTRSCSITRGPGEASTRIRKREQAAKERLGGGSAINRGSRSGEANFREAIV